jgi:serine/threonine protein kinase/tetratricopeptide (TPR) repeat protein
MNRTNQKQQPKQPFKPVRFGKYLLLDRLATGGMAEVYLAKSYGVMGFEKPLVIKKILPRLSRNQEFVQLFITEAKIAVRLNHPNVVQVFDLGAHGDDYFIAMEFIHGQDLMRVIKHGRATGAFLPIPISLFIVSEMARGLDFAHRLTDSNGQPLGLIHQDISPHNVLISYEGDVKLLDFGIARLGAMSDAENAVAGGKFAYMAPEQARGEPVDHRADVFSTAIVLWELVTGERLYAGKDPELKREMVLNAAIPEPVEINPEIPLALNDIIMRGLAFDPEDRFEAAIELSDALQDFLFEAGARVGREEMSQHLRLLFPDEAQRPTANLEALFSDLDAMVAAEAMGAEQPPPALLLEPAPAPETDEASPADSLGGVLQSLSAGERRVVVSTVVEIVGLPTPKVETEESALALQMELLRRLSQLAERYGGHLEGLDPEWFTVHMGLVRAVENESERALRCAVALALEVRAFARAKGLSLAVTQGMARGTMVVTERPSQRFAPVAGYMSLARRLCSSGEPGEIRIDPQIRGDLEEVGRFRREMVQVRPGTELLEKHYSFLGFGSAPQEGDGRGNWVRRGDEFEIFKTALRGVLAGRQAWLLIEGEAGCGKSRFLHEIRRLASRNSIPVYSGRAVFYDQETPMRMVRELVGEILGVRQGDPVEVQQRAVERVAELGLPAIHKHVLGHLFDLRFADSPLRFFSAEQIHTAMRQALRQLLQVLASKQFTILVIESLQWVDEASRLAMATLMGSLPEARLLFVFTGRLGCELPLADSEQKLHRIQLPGMSPDASVALARDLIGVNHLPPELEALLTEHSGGNALFIKEIVRSLRAQGLLVEQDGAVRLKNLTNFRPPATLQDLIASRLESLDRGDRLVLEIASVIGSSFDMTLLRAVVGAGSDVSLRVERLLTVELLRKAEDDAPASHRFKNNVTWRVVYERMVAARRRELHARVGEAMERVYAARVDALLEVLAHHFAKGGLLERAARFAERAAQRYARDYLYRAALRAYMRCLELVGSANLETLERASWEARVLESVARLQLRAGSLDEAARSVALASDRAEEAADRALEARACLTAGRIQRLRGRPIEAGASIELAVRMAEQAGDRGLLCDAHEAHGEWFLENGDHAAAYDHLAKALDAASQDGDQTRVAHIVGAFGRFHVMRGDHEKAAKRLQKAHDLSRQTGDRDLEAGVLDELGVLAVQQGDTAAALQHFEQALTIREGLGLSQGVASGLLRIGEVQLRSGNLAAAQAAFERSLGLSEETGWSVGCAHNRLFLGYLLALGGRGPEGVQQMRDALAAAQQQDARPVVAVGNALLARALEALGLDDEARRSLGVAREAAEASGSSVLQAEVTRLGGESSG